MQEPPRGTFLTEGAPTGGDFFAFSKVSQSSRRRSGAKKMKFVFCGGVYVAKNTLRGAKCRSPAIGGARRGAQREPIPKGLCPLGIKKETAIAVSFFIKD